MMDLPPVILSKIDTNGPNGCWLWTASMRPNGYGQINFKSRVSKAHRVVWEIVNGPIPEGMEIDHICHNRACVNPAHLRLATLQENRCSQLRHSNNKSGFKGVVFRKDTQRWSATIMAKGRAYALGCFGNAEEAYAAYLEASKRLHGEFACAGVVS